MRELFTPLLRFASFFFPFILFPLLDTFSPSLAFLAQSGIGNALPPSPPRVSFEILIRG